MQKIRSSISNWDNGKTLLRKVDYHFQGGKKSKGNLERMVLVLSYLKVSLTKYSENLSVLRHPSKE
jgi:hypothetical protein